MSEEKTGRKPLPGARPIRAGVLRAALGCQRLNIFLAFARARFFRWRCLSNTAGALDPVETLDDFRPFVHASLPAVFYPCAMGLSRTVVNRPSRNQSWL